FEPSNQSGSAGTGFAEDGDSARASGDRVVQMPNERTELFGPASKALDIETSTSRLVPGEWGHRDTVAALRLEPHSRGIRGGLEYLVTQPVLGCARDTNRNGD